MTMKNNGTYSGLFLNNGQVAPFVSSVTADSQNKTMTGLFARYWTDNSFVSFVPFRASFDNPISFTMHINGSVVNFPAQVS
ncbi:hypothetical protein DFA_05556 [Cavenderia fasciculata]|uniref:Uncharacterized protein n=1 Tax=Cavenderia fasciculata TaxID=261658 RepID=F4PLK2_CACFS|nr:uncharacterized protein DFA_05556 [Cavenderia fasciculata]EGG23424.1 hypothetical protein DFA_05556 [Cavenderia fasciculata]|eukprot:XP_004361275.1 hypothetical protein DFA_05556 [Cavenderia fasciculata]